MPWTLPILLPNGWLEGNLFIYAKVFCLTASYLTKLTPTFLWCPCSGRQLNVTELTSHLVNCCIWKAAKIRKAVKHDLNHIHHSFLISFHEVDSMYCKWVKRRTKKNYTESKCPVLPCVHITFPEPDGNSDEKLLKVIFCSICNIIAGANREHQTI